MTAHGIGRAALTATRYRQAADFMPLKRRIVSLANGVLMVGVTACGPPWHEYHSRDGDFSVQLQGEPEPFDEVAQRPTGPRRIRGIHVRVEGVIPPTRLAFFRVSSYEAPGPTATPRDVAARLDEARDENLADPEIHAVLVSEAPLSRSNGREAVVTFGENLRLVEHTFLHGGRIYRVGTVAKQGESRAETDRFLKSFQFTEPLSR